LELDQTLPFIPTSPVTLSLKVFFNLEFTTTVSEISAGVTIKCGGGIYLIFTGKTKSPPFEVISILPILSIIFIYF
jgi:hypothetical protein